MVTRHDELGIGEREEGVTMVTRHDELDIRDGDV